MCEARCNIRRPHRHTCQWILEQQAFRSWEKQTRGFLWIKGKPGSGKSTLAVFLWDRVQETCSTEEEISLEFFFNARGHHLQQTPLGMLQALLAQLCRRDPFTCRMMQSMYQNKCNTSGLYGQDWNWQQPELEQLFQKAIIDCSQRHCMSVFVDALDEAGERRASDLMAYFDQLVAEIAAVRGQTKFLISCRHYPALAVLPGLSICVEAHNKKDIAAFLHHHLKLENFEVRCYTEDKKLWKALITDISDRAQGVFLWAVLVVPLMRKRILDGHSLEEIYCLLNHVPNELADLYRFVIEFVIEPTYLDNSFLLFQWVCLATTPLSVTALRYAIAASRAISLPQITHVKEAINFVENDRLMASKIGAWSGGLVEVMQDGQTVQPIHQTVKDFFVTQGLNLLLRAPEATESARDQTYDPMSRGHLMLYRSCLNYLTTEIGRLNLKNYEQERLFDQFPFLGYTAENLFFHAEKASQTQSLNLESDVESLQTAMGPWHIANRKIYGNLWDSTKKGSSLYHEASGANLVNIVEALSTSAQASAKDHQGDTALHYAARNGHEEIAKVLLRSGADLSATNDHGETPLIIAARCGRASYVEWQLPQMANLGGAAKEILSALTEAAASGHDQVVQILLRTGLMAEAQKNIALLQAARWGNTRVAETYLKAGLEANVTVEGQSPLHVAIINAHAEVAKLLLKHGADPSSRDEYGRSSLHLIAEQGMGSLIYCVGDCDLDAKDWFGRTPLHMAVYHGRVDLVECLLRLGADPCILDGYGRTSLDWLSAYQPIPDVFMDICSSHTRTPQADQTRALRRSVLDLSMKLLTSTREETPTEFHELGHCLLFLNDLDGAIQSFSQHAVVADDGTIIHNVPCSYTRHIDRMFGSRWVCKSCPDVDICSDCISDSGRAYSMTCQNHKFLEVPGPMLNNDRRWLEDCAARYQDSAG